MSSLSSFVQRFSSLLPPLVQNGEQVIRHHIYWWLFIRMIFLTFLLTLTAFFMERGNMVLLPPFEGSAVFLLIVYSFSIGSTLILRKLSAFSLQFFSMVQLIIDIFLVCLLIYATGCKQSIFTPALVLPMIVGGLILYRREALLLAAVATFSYGCTLGLELLGMVPLYYFNSSVYQPSTSPVAATNLFAIYGLLFFFSVLFSGQLARHLRVTQDALSRTALKYDRLVLLYKQIFDDIPTGIITVDHQDFITSYNQAARSITGYPIEKVLGRSFDRCFPDIFIHDEEKGRQVCDFKKYDQIMTRLGYTFTRLNMPRTEDEEGSDESGPAKWKVISIQDISQIERMEQQMREAEKMAAIGEMSASIAHDLRNPLAAISGSAQILSLEQNTPDRLDPAAYATLLGIILRESERMAKTITSFLQFARPAQLVFERLNLGMLVTEAILALRSGKHQETAQKIRSLLPDAQYICWADRKQMTAVLLQVMENACLAMEGKEGEILVGARKMEGMPPGICLEICDQGPGIPSELRGRVFAPFFSNRTDGIGLGLSIARQIVENHGGTIAIDDNPDYACIVRICLPLTQIKIQV